MTPDERDRHQPPPLHDLLAGAIPDLKEPPDRLGAVGARVARSRRRHRWSAVTAAIAVAAITLGVTFAVRGPNAGRVPVSPAPPARCGVEADRLPVPPHAASVTLCAVLPPKSLFDPTADWAQSHRPRVLTRNVDDMVAAINAVVHAPACPAPLPNPWEYTLVVTYADGSQKTVAPNNYCGGGAGKLVDTFFTLYRSQLAAGHPLIFVPGCAATRSVADLDLFHASGRPVDAIGLTRNDFFRPSTSPPLEPPVGQPFFPSPIRAVRICVYDRDGSAWSRSGQGTPSPAGAQSLLSDAAARAVTNPGGSNPVSSCDPGAAVPDRFVDIFVTDSTGLTSEVRVWRTPCELFQTANGVTGQVPPALTSWLTGLGFWN
jgi:hypothetical protein